MGSRPCRSEGENGTLLLATRHYYGPSSCGLPRVYRRISSPVPRTRVLPPTLSRPPMRCDYPTSHPLERAVTGIHFPSTNYSSHPRKRSLQMLRAAFRPETGCPTCHLTPHSDLDRSQVHISFILRKSGLAYVLDFESCIPPWIRPILP